MDNNNRNSNQSNQRPMRPQQGQRPTSQQPVRPQQGQPPVRPQMQQQRPVRPQQQGQRPIRSEYEQSSGRMQRPVRPEYEQSQDRMPRYEQNQQVNFGYEQQTQDNSFEDFNSEVVHDTVAENKARGKKQKKVKEKKVLTPEQKKKRIMIAGAITAGLLIIFIAVTIISNVLEKSSQHINVAGNIPQKEQTEQVEQSTDNEVQEENENTEDTNNEETENTKVEQLPVENIDAKECSEQSPLDINEYTYMNLIVNTKTAQDKAYTDREAKVYTKLSNVVTGYNNVSNYIKEYNETNTQNKNITLPTSLEYYGQSNGTEMVMLEFELLYPADFPTSASSGVVYRIPQASLNVYGTVEEIDSEEITSVEGYDPHNYIVVDDVIYNVSKITDISVYERNTDKGIKIGEPIIFRYITALPVGASSDVYGIKLDIDLDTEDIGKDSANYWFKGQSISASDELKEAQKQIEEETGNTDTDEQSENSDEQTENNEEQTDNSNEQSEVEE